jgi:hypothetical protein
LLALVLLGTSLGFGGVVWWAAPLVAVGSFMMVTAVLTRLVFAGRLPILKSPLTLLGLAVLVLALAQLIPLPGPIARRLSPRAADVYARGFFQELARADDPHATLPEPAQARTPASLNRSATLRWLVLATACLGIFWAATHFADRLGRAYLIWGCIVGAFLLNGAIAMVQVAAGTDGLFGFLNPGSAPSWAPSRDDFVAAPGALVLRDLPGQPNPAGDPSPRWSMPIPVRPYLLGTMMGGPGAFLALGSLGMPLGLAVLLHLIVPRGSRESLSDRLGHSGQGGLVVLMTVLLLTSAGLVGLVAGPRFAWPFLIGLVAVGLPSARVPGARGASLGLLVLLSLAMGLGVGLGQAWPLLTGGPPLIPVPDWNEAQSLWHDGLAMLRDFPLLGVGLGGFATVEPFYKTHDASSTTAMSSLVQWAAESGLIGLALAGLGVVWCLARLPGSIRRVGTADRCLVYGLIGAALGFSLFSIVHWTVELTAVAISASALGGTWNRWLAGGTDLFVERG